ncbi:MAG: metal-dependent transcriptional regulator [Planctomycetes bacterium]|nr:metal-dependent transcriptional regulator [Planctomycetota bacterium]
MLENKPSPTLLAYVESIYKLSSASGAAHASDIAESLGVHKSTVTAALRSLRQLGLVRYQAYEPVVLTDEGTRQAEKAVCRNAVVAAFLTQVLALRKEEAENLAPRIASAITGEVLNRMAAFVQSTCPTCARHWLNLLQPEAEMRLTIA